MTMKRPDRLRIALQKKGRLADESLRLLEKAGVKFRKNKSALFYMGENLPIDVLLVRDDDIPGLVMNGSCELGIIGENILHEKQFERQDGASAKLIIKLGFSYCRLAIALPAEEAFSDITSLQGMQIATSYPLTLNAFLTKHNIGAHIIDLSGSVEIAPRLGIADAICDLVATGRTLEENNLKEVMTVLESQAVLIRQEKELSAQKTDTIALLLQRIEGVLKARESKYIMLHAPKYALAEIKALLPGNETPTMLALSDNEEKVALHVVSMEAVFWDTLERLKSAGASSILVLPIEKML